jgi:hypothetical protein
VNLDDLTIGQAKELAQRFAGLIAPPPPAAAEAAAHNAPHKPIPVIVCTDKRGVVFGYTTDINARPIVLTQARMCLYWSADVGGVFGLGEIGPTKDCKISAPLTELRLEGVTAVMSVDDKAERAWVAAKVQGR